MRHSFSTTSIFSTASLYPSEVKQLGLDRAHGLVLAARAWEAATDEQRQAAKVRGRRNAAAWRASGDRAKPLHIKSCLADLTVFRAAGHDSLTNGIRYALALHQADEAAPPHAGAVWTTFTMRSVLMSRALATLGPEASQRAALARVVQSAMGVWGALPAALQAHCVLANVEADYASKKTEGANGQTSCSLPQDVVRALKAIGQGNISRGARTVLRVYIDVREGRTPTLFTGFTG